MDRPGIIHGPSEGLPLTGRGGGSILLKAGRAETRGAYAPLQLTAPPGSPWGAHHIHDATEAWYVLDGELTFRLGDDMVPAATGSFVLAPGGIPDLLVNGGSRTAESLVIFSPAGLEDLLIELSRPIESARPNQPSPEAIDRLSRHFGIVAV
jgi:quercetin dioxygenase-like cupin family protein